MGDAATFDLLEVLQGYIYTRIPEIAREGTHGRGPMGGVEGGGSLPPRGRGIA
jgi:hypothetical protein